MQLADVTLALFSLFNLLRLGSYVPQVLRVAHDTDGARSISYATWLLWVAANISTAAYAIVNISDWKLFAVSVINALGCGLVVMLTMWKRRQMARRPS